jgi:hypothetical protein
MKVCIWEKEQDYYGDDWIYECPFCEWAMTLHCGDVIENDYNYCPNCGKQLIKEIEEKGGK